MDTIKSILKKLSDSCTELHQAKSHLSGVTSLSIDDEFEVEFLVDSILKNATKMSRIVKNYDRVQNAEITEESSHGAELSPVTENSLSDVKVTSYGTLVSQDLSFEAKGLSGFDAKKCLLKKEKDNTQDGTLGQAVVSLVLQSDTDSECEDTVSALLAVDSGQQVEASSSVYQERHPAQRVGESDTDSDVTVDLDTSAKDVVDQKQEPEATRISNEDLSLLEKSEIEGCLEAFAADEFDDDTDFNDNMVQESKKAENEALDKTTLEQIASDHSEPEEQQDDEVTEAVDQKYLSILKSYFGFSQFRPMQWRIINAVLNDHRDNCVLMATGYGKSLCYQYLSVYTGRTTVVVSPLISLMEDQVLALSAVKIPACFLGSAQDRMAEVRREMLQGKYRVVYITPEFCEVARDMLTDLHNSVGIDLVAIDEAHCVCQWGHDFRKAYRSLGCIRQVLPQVPLMALTATATPAVTKDICKSLGLRNPLLTSTGFDRVNLFLSASRKTGDIVHDLRSRMVRQGNKYVFEGSVIVYCPTKKATEDIQSVLTTLGVKSAIYHAGLSKSTRRKTHQQFVNDEIQVVAATVAFGMGIDKPDVRQVIHYGAPRDIESYYQEIGRAGRDGGEAKCHAFYSDSDFNTNMFFLKDIDNKVHYDHRLKMFRKMKEYLPSIQCRRKLILVHFADQSSVRMRSSCCDNCQQMLLAQAQGHDLPDHSKPQNFGIYALDLFQTIEAMHTPRGLGTYCMFLLGTATDKVARYSSHKLFGKYKGNRTISKKFLQALGHQLIAEGYLYEEKCEGFFGTVVSLLARARQFLDSNRRQENPQLMLVPNAEMLQVTSKENKPKPTIVMRADSSKVILPTVPTGEWLSTSELQAKTNKVTGSAQMPALSDKDKLLMHQLLAKLMTLRNDIASEKGLNSFNVFTNRTLSDMAMYRPTSQGNLSQIDDVALQRVNLYGEHFMSTIKDFCEQHDWPTDVMPQQQKVTLKLSGSMEQAYAGLTDTCKTSYFMFERENRSLENVALARGIKTITVCGHLATCIEAGLPVDIERLGVTSKIQELIIRTIRAAPIKSDISRLTPIKEQLPDYVTFDQIRLVVAIMKRRFGIKDCNYVAEEAASEQHTARQSSLLQYVHETDNSPKLSRQSSSQQDSTDQGPVCGSGQGSVKKRALPQSLLRVGSLSKKQKTEKMRKNSLFAR